MRARYLVGGFKVEMETHFDLTAKRAEKYRFDFDGEPDIIIDPGLERLKKIKELKSIESMEMSEYLLTGVYFNHFALPFGAFTLHSSAVHYKGKGYLFSAECGTGKSTHTKLWLDNIKGAKILNDDKPFVHQKDGKFVVSGTPWSGKHNLSDNLTVELGGIAFLERAKVPFIEKADSLFATSTLIYHTGLPSEKEISDLFAATLDSLVRSVPIYRFGCDISTKSLKTSFEAMTGEIFNS